MQLDCGGNEYYLDGLVLDCILSSFNARELARLSAVCKALRSPAQLAAHRALLAIVRRLDCTLLRHCERGSWIHQLAEWETLAAATEQQPRQLPDPSFAAPLKTAIDAGLAEARAKIRAKEEEAVRMQKNREAKDRLFERKRRHLAPAIQHPET